MEYQTAQLTMDVYKLQKKRVPQPKMNNNGVFGGKFHLYINHNTGVPTINCRLVADTEKVHYPDNLQSDGWCMQSFKKYLSLWEVEKDN